MFILINPLGGPSRFDYYGVLLTVEVAKGFGDREKKCPFPLNSDVPLTEVTDTMAVSR